MIYLKLTTVFIHVPATDSKEKGPSSNPSEYAFKAGRMSLETLLLKVII